MQRNTAHRICELARERNINPILGIDRTNPNNERVYSVILLFPDGHDERITRDTYIADLWWLDDDLWFDGKRTPKAMGLTA